jgi:hypothetical protein
MPRYRLVIHYLGTTVHEYEADTEDEATQRALAEDQATFELGDFLNCVEAVDLDTGEIL